MAQTIRLTPSLKKLAGEVILPGSKSHTNRCLIAAALASGRSVLQQASLSDDSRALITALIKLGVKISVQADSIIVTGAGGNFLPQTMIINVCAGGTTMRFLTALCSAIPGARITLGGTARLNRRPIKELVNSLRQLGADIAYLNQAGQAPLLIKGKKLAAIKPLSLDGTVSSQFISALLLISPLLKTGLTVNILGVPVSASYLEMTAQAMQAFGVNVSRRHERRFLVKPGQSYEPRTCPIEGDASGASYFWALAAVALGTVRVKNISPDSVQGDVQFVRLLEKMGCLVAVNKRERWIEVTGPEVLTGITANMRSMPDTAQTLAVVAAFAQGRTKVTGLETLKNKETDRLLAVKTELKKMGIFSRTTSDSIIVTGGRPTSARIKTYQDHRMAMSFSVAVGKITMEISDPRVVNKSFPGFWEQLKNLGIKVSHL